MIPMQLRIGTILFLLCLFSLCNAHNQDQLERKNGKLYLVNDRGSRLVNEKVITVKLKSGVKHLSKEYTVLRSNELGFIDLTVPQKVDVVEYASDLRKTGIFELVKYAEYAEICFIPNDTYLTNQWYLNAINIFDAWNFVVGSPSVRIAVLDTELDWTHPDIGYGTDNYKNIDESLGYNYYWQTSGLVSPLYHGTMVAGIIGAKMNNMCGVAGIAGGNNSSGVTVIPIAINLYDDLYLDMSVVDDAILLAMNNGAKVVNMSFRSLSNNFPDIDAAITLAQANGVSFVAASGNDNSSIGYPASNPKVIAVGAIDQSLNRRSSSNYGSGLCLVAPGESIYSLSISNMYNTASGTSFSAPQVSGVIGLMLSVNPYLTPEEIMDILKNSCTKITGYTYNDSGWNSEVGYGLLNAYSAVIQAYKMYIDGDSIPTLSSVYSVANLPNGCSVTWNYSGTTMTTATMTTNSPMQNQCTISNPNKEYLKGTLTATVWYGSSVVATHSKAIDNGIDISGYYHQSAYIFDNYSIPESYGSFNCGDTIVLYKGSTITLTAPQFTYATVTYTGSSVKNWSHVGNTISFEFRNFEIYDPFVPQSRIPDLDLSQIKITGNYTDNYNSWEFLVRALPPISNTRYSLINEEADVSISALNSTITVTTPAEGSELTIVNSLTGQVVYKEIVDNTITISTMNWPKGTYVVMVKKNDKSTFKKVNIN